jgi:ribosomal-protein-serine acetyltransferase
MTIGPMRETQAVLRFDLPGGCHLRLFEESDAEEVARVTAANQAYLAEWLPWAAGPGGTEARREFIRHSLRQYADDAGFQAAIVDGDEIAGAIGFHAIDWQNRSTSIGYWLAEDRQGRGTVTEAVHALTTYAFEVWRLNRVEIRAAVGNVRSAAVPKRLGFVEEGVLRQAERHGETFKDLAVFAILASDWPPTE